MSHLFFDTSAFAKRYHPEKGSRKVEQLFLTPNSVFQVSNLGVLEAQSAFFMKVRTNQISPDDAFVLRQHLLADVAAQVVKVVFLDSSHVTSAEKLVMKYGSTRRMRSLDALQLGVALDLSVKGLLDIFVVADRLLAEVAESEGLSTLNPEDFP